MNEEQFIPLMNSSFTKVSLEEKNNLEKWDKNRFCIFYLIRDNINKYINLFVLTRIDLSNGVDKEKIFLKKMYLVYKIYQNDWSLE